MAIAASGSAAQTAAAAGWYVYGVVPAGEVPPDLLEGAHGVDATHPLLLIAADGVAAIASGVRLDEFGEAGLEANLHDETWLQERASAHDAVLETVLGRVPLVPFRFGTVRRTQAHVRTMLAENASIAEALERLAGRIELGVKAFLDTEALGWARAGEAEPDVGSGRAYLRRKQR